MKCPLGGLIRAWHLATQGRRDPAEVDGAPPGQRRAQGQFEPRLACARLPGPGDDRGEHGFDAMRGRAGCH